MKIILDIPEKDILTLLKKGEEERIKREQEIVDFARQHNQDPVCGAPERSLETLILHAIWEYCT